MIHQIFNIPCTISGAGLALPKGPPVTNRDLLQVWEPDQPEAALEVLAERITKRFGFTKRNMVYGPTASERRISHSETLAYAAAQKALNKAATIVPQAVVVGSTTSPRYTGSMSSAIAGKLGIDGYCVDVKAGCATSLASLTTAYGLIATGVESVLVVAAETMTAVLSPDQRDQWFGLADGAAAIVLTRSENPDFVVDTVISGSLGEHCDLYTTPAVLPAAENLVLTGDGAELQTIAASAYHGMFTELARTKNFWPHTTVLVPHQINRQLITNVAADFQASEKVYWVGDRYGCCGGAATLMALVDLMENEKPFEKPFEKSGHLVLAAVGGGVNFASHVWRRP